MFPLGRVANYIKRVNIIHRRISSQAGPLTHLVVDNDGLAILTMQRMPGNSLNLELLEDLSKSLDEVARNGARAMILTSGISKVFSTGLDVMEMYRPDIKRAEAFWTALQEVWLKLFGSTFISAAAINGHATGSGCVLAMSCEFRAMVAGEFSIGLDETALNIAAPTWFVDTMCHTMPVRQVELALGRLFLVEKALMIGLVDETANDAKNAIAKCKAFIKKFDKIPRIARYRAKLKLRDVPIKRLQENRKQDTAEFLQAIEDIKIQQYLEIYIRGMEQNARRSIF